MDERGHTQALEHTFATTLKTVFPKIPISIAQGPKYFGLVLEKLFVGISQTLRSHTQCVTRTATLCCL